MSPDWSDKRRILSSGLTFLAWLATVGLGLVVLHALRQMSFGLFALLGLDVRTAQLASLGEHNRPDSITQWVPVISPQPLKAWKPAKQLSRQISPSRGTVTVTPVRATCG